MFSSTIYKQPLATVLQIQKNDKFCFQPFPTVIFWILF